jgi:hypothetical protein
MKCRNSAFNAQGWRAITVVLQVGAVKIYVAALKALRKKRKRGSSLPPKLVEKLVWVPAISFCKISFPVTHLTGRSRPLIAWLYGWLYYIELVIKLSNLCYSWLTWFPTWFFLFFLFFIPQFCDFKNLGNLSKTKSNLYTWKKVTMLYLFFKISPKKIHCSITKIWILFELALKGQQSH